MKLLLLGSTGLLGPAIAAQASRRGHQVIGAARKDAEVALDISDDKHLLNAVMAVDPEAIVNCAALTNVEECERDPSLAYRVNARPLTLLADWSKHLGRPLLHISTDHFFTDGGASPHREDDRIELVNEYARTKYAGEAFALTSAHALVIRTAIVGIRGWEKPTLAEWAINALESRHKVTLFDDAYTSCIDANALACACLHLLAQGESGLINVASREVFSKGDLIRELARQMNCPLDGVTASVNGLTPPRPSSLGLDVSKAETLLQRPLPTLDKVVSAVLEQYRAAA